MLSKQTTAQKIKFSIKDIFGKYDQIRSFLMMWQEKADKSKIHTSRKCQIIYTEH